MEGSWELISYLHFLHTTACLFKFMIVILHTILNSLASFMREHHRNSSYPTTRRQIQWFQHPVLLPSISPNIIAASPQTLSLSLSLCTPLLPYFKLRKKSWNYNRAFPVLLSSSFNHSFTHLLKGLSSLK